MWVKYLYINIIKKICERIGKGLKKTQNMELDKLIDQTEKDIKQGRTRKIKTANLWK